MRESLHMGIFFERSEFSILGNVCVIPHYSSTMKVCLKFFYIGVPNFVIDPKVAHD